MSVGEAGNVQMMKEAENLIWWNVSMVTLGPVKCLFMYQDKLKMSV